MSKTQTPTINSRSRHQGHNIKVTTSRSQTPTATPTPPLVCTNYNYTTLYQRSIVQVTQRPVRHTTRNCREREAGEIVSCAGVEAPSAPGPRPRCDRLSSCRPRRASLLRPPSLAGAAHAKRDARRHPGQACTTVVADLTAVTRCGPVQIASQRPPGGRRKT